MANTETISIRKMDVKRVKIRIVGDTPLITHAWDEKAKRMIVEQQTGKASKTKKHPTKMPFDDFARAFHWITPMPTETITDQATGEKRDVVTEALFEKAVENGAKFGFPTNAFKIAGNAAAYRMGWVKNQMALRNAYFITSEYGDLAEVHFEDVQMREDMVKVGMGTCDVRYRPEFRNWYCDLWLEVNASSGISLDDVINVINAGGYGVGIGEWRPERDGINGRYHVEIVK